MRPRDLRLPLVRAPWRPRADDLAGLAHLCPDCLGRAGENPFLRFRLRAALDGRGGGAAARNARSAVRDPRASRGLDPGPASVRRDRPLLRGPGGGVRRLVPATRPLRPRPVDDWPGRWSSTPRRSGSTGCLSPARSWSRGGNRLVVGAPGARGSSALRRGGGALDRARARLLAHGLRAHLHVRDAWAGRTAPSTRCSGGSG